MRNIATLIGETEKTDMDRLMAVLGEVADENHFKRMGYIDSTGQPVPPMGKHWI